jgi:hypothetical protein
MQKGVFSSAEKAIDDANPLRTGAEARPIGDGAVAAQGSQAVALE